MSGLKAHIRNHVRLGEMFHSLVESRPDLFSVLTPAAFAVTVFTVVPASGRPGKAEGHSSLPPIADGLVKDDAPRLVPEQAQEEANTVTEEVYELINARGEIYLTSSIVNGTYVIRVVSANPKAEEKYIIRAFDILQSVAEEVLSKQKANGAQE